jgi:hypothetical protein
MRTTQVRGDLSTEVIIDSHSYESQRPEPRAIGHPLHERRRHRIGQMNEPPGSAGAEG